MDGPDADCPSAPDGRVFDQSIRRGKAVRRTAKVEWPVVPGVDIGVEPGIALRRAEKP